MLLDGRRPAGERRGSRRRRGRRLAARVRWSRRCACAHWRLGRRPSCAAFSPSVFSMIGLQPRLVEQRLEDQVLVGVTDALHDDLAETPGGVDQHDPSGIRSRYRSRTSRPRPPRSERTIRCTPIESATFEMVEALDLAVADRAIGEQRGETATARVEQLSLAAMLRNVSCCPAKLASGRSSAVALLRTATPSRSLPLRNASSR